MMPGTFIYIEELIALENLAAALYDHILDIACQNLVRNHHAQVSGNCRETGNTGEFPVEICIFHNRHVRTAT